MFFVITVALLLVGVFCLRKDNPLAGYGLLIAGWLHAMFQNIYTDKSWEAAFTTFFMGLFFICYVQWKLDNNKKLARLEELEQKAARADGRKKSAN